jgi:hypothetical protein
MEARTTRRPGQKGTKKLVQRFGDRLIFVRYRYDLQRRRRYTTVELIVDEQPWTPTPAASLSVTATLNPDSEVTLRIGVHEPRIRARIKEAGGKWDPASGVWMLPLRRARALGLQDRIVTV